MFEAMGRILRGINGNVSFTVPFFLFKHSTHFLITLHMYCNEGSSAALLHLENFKQQGCTIVYSVIKIQ